MARFRSFTLNIQLGVGGRGGWVMGIEEGTFWDEHWVLYGNQCDNKFHILKKKLKKNNKIKLLEKKELIIIYKKTDPQETSSSN